jgi:hypothetical protein
MGVNFCGRIISLIRMMSRAYDSDPTLKHASWISWRSILSSGVAKDISLLGVDIIFNL